MDFWLEARSFMFPRSCALCRSDLEGEKELRVGLCATCSTGLFFDAARRCPRCGRPLISERDCCSDCRVHPLPAFDGAYSLFRYGGAAKRLLLAYKFGARKELSRIWGMWMVEVLHGPAAFPACIDTVIPVPPRPGKIRQRGWDQVEQLARVLEREHHVPICRPLVRLPSRSQKELNREQRLENLRGRIKCTGIRAESVVLIDDVITTGSTLSACALALKESGVRRVYALTLCAD